MLTRPVLGFFIDRMTIAGLPPVPESLVPAIGYARMGQFADVLRVVDESRSDHVVGSFLAGVAELARGDVNRAALDFSQALKTVPGFFPAAFYLGACYAAGGQDKEAATVWRTTLVTDPSAPWIYTALSDALLRANETAQALNLLREVVKLWPDNDDVLMRWGTALSMAGQPDQAIKTLDAYLSRRPPTVTAAAIHAPAVRSANSRPPARHRRRRPRAVPPLLRRVREAQRGEAGHGPRLAQTLRRH